MHNINVGPSHPRLTITQPQLLVPFALRRRSHIAMEPDGEWLISTRCVVQCSLHRGRCLLIGYIIPSSEKIAAACGFIYVCISTVERKRAYSPSLPYLEPRQYPKLEPDAEQDRERSQNSPESAKKSVSVSAKKISKAGSKIS